MVKTFINGDKVFDLPKPRAGNTMVYVVPVSSGVDSSATALIVNKVHHTANGLGVAFGGVYTFDAAAQQIPGTKKP